MSLVGSVEYAMLMEMMAVVGLAKETDRLANGLRIPVDARFTR